MFDLQSHVKVETPRPHCCTTARVQARPAVSCMLLDNPGHRQVMLMYICTQWTVKTVADVHIHGKRLLSAATHSSCSHSVAIPDVTAATVVA